MSTDSKQKVFYALSTIIVIFFVLIIVLIFHSDFGVSHVELPTLQNDTESFVQPSPCFPNYDGLESDNSLQFVKPLKIHNFPLNEEDLLFESKRYGNKAYNSAYSSTGNYRSNLNPIWDPHPEYTLHAFGHYLHLVLYQDNSFLNVDNFRVFHVFNNDTHIQDDSEHFLGCYYRGYVKGDDKSTVAVSLCSGMRGQIKTSFGALLIQPIANCSEDDSQILHKIWRETTKGRIARENPTFEEPFTNKSQLLPKLVRRKRSYAAENLFTLEVLVAVDHTMSDFHKDDLKSYILTLISIVSSIFSDASIGNSIYISVNNIVILKDDVLANKNVKNIAAKQLLKMFCSFIKKQTYHYDTAIMLTRDQICWNETEAKCDTLGLAELGTVCKRHSCSIVQDNGLPAAFTMAHELGHVLNMPHDDDYNMCSRFNHRGRSSLNIMSSAMGDNMHPWSWSDCSRHYVSDFLERADTSCLEDSPLNYERLNSKFAGEVYSLDQQCELIYGPGSRYCSLERDCKRLWCTSFKNITECESSNLPWADGTPCTGGYWCEKGECVPREGRQIVVVNGGWGVWSAFSKCTMECGGGVQESQRECDNPLPQNGGKYCSGNRKKYRSCNTQPCPPGAMDSREEQCSEMNGNNFRIRGLGPNVTWVPKYGLSSEDKCKLYCRVDKTSSYFQLKEMVKDGTRCSLENFDKCVNGICRKGGCDNELNSSSQLDRCGVCEGSNNTCKDIHGTYSRPDMIRNMKKVKSIYYYVTTIPKVLRDDNGNSLLNGNLVINTYRNVFFYAGVTFEYNGSNSTLERVNTTYARKIKRDLIVEIISLIPEPPDGIFLVYNYTVDTNDNDLGDTVEEPPEENYQWKYDEWSDCSAICQGKSYRTVNCVEREMSLKVPIPFCDPTTKPSADLFRDCNTDCKIILNKVNVSQCSASCGMVGVREFVYTCVQQFQNNSRTTVDMLYCESLYHIQKFEQCSEGCWKYTDWSQCSEQCGNGHQTRSVFCSLNGTIVADSHCPMSKSHLSQTTQSCIGKMCPSRTYTFHKTVHQPVWNYSDWSECGENCEKTRTVTCLRSHCPEHLKPVERIKCCRIKYISMWSPCSVECGTGVRKKEFYCAKVFQPKSKGQHRQRVKVDSIHCKDLKIPNPKRSKKDCKINCSWQVSKWSSCATCDVHFSTRSLNCSTSVGRQIAHKNCEFMKKPTTHRICPHCIHREYTYSNCSCDGYRKRKIVCYDHHRKPVFCPNKQEITKERCNPPEDCFPKSCIELRKNRRRPLVDGEYTLYFNKVPVRIFCHNMHSKPKEYITVNPDKNYSIFYGRYYKGENSSNTCPLIQKYTKNNFNTLNQYAEKTTFKKIRINVHSFRIIENDFTYANYTGGPQQFASAGDCWKRSGCQLGQFSVNLENTSFVLKPDIKWATYGDKNIISSIGELKYPYKYVRGVCGGSCGGCSVSKSSYIVLDVETRN